MPTLIFTNRNYKNIIANLTHQARYFIDREESNVIQRIIPPHPIEVVDEASVVCVMHRSEHTPTRYSRLLRCQLKQPRVIEKNPESIMVCDIKKTIRVRQIKSAGLNDIINGIREGRVRASH